MIPYLRTAKLARWQIWMLTISGTALWLSGGLWLLLHYYGQTRGEFGPETNPLEPWMMKAHGLVLIPALMGIGGLFVAHIPKGWTHRHQRVAGIALCGFLGLLIVTGYMLYYVGAEDVRAWTSVVHWSLGLALPAIFVWHYRGSVRARQRS